ncbi:hypothetical protein GF352_03140 [archaeon]|nr:hypothetical protein [archaeon]
MWFGVVNEEGGLNNYSLDEVVKKASEWISIGSNEESFKKRLKYLTGKVNELEEAHYEQFKFDLLKKLNIKIKKNPEELNNVLSIIKTEKLPETKAFLDKNWPVKTLDEILGLFEDDNFFNLSKGINTVLFDLGGQPHFYFMYKEIFKQADGVLLFFDFNNNYLMGMVDNTEMDQLRDTYEHHFPKDTMSYVRSKSDIGYLMNQDEDGNEKNEFTVNMSDDFIKRYEKADMVMPTCSFDSWGNDGVLAAINALVLRHLDIGKIKSALQEKKAVDRTNKMSLKLVIAGKGNAGKTTLINKYHSLAIRDPRVMRKTFMSVGQGESEGLFINSSVFYAHDAEDNLYLVNSEGEVTNYIKVDKYSLEKQIFEGTDPETGKEQKMARFRTDCSIESFTLYDADYNVLETYDGLMWSGVIKSLYQQGISPLLDLKSIGRIAQFMIPSKWGLDIPDGFFLDKPEFLKSRYEKNKSLYEDELA